VPVLTTVGSAVRLLRARVERLSAAQPD
jgi:hypothetical protein